MERTEVTGGMGEMFRHHYFGDVNVDRKTILKCVLKMGHECLDWIALPRVRSGELSPIISFMQLINNTILAQVLCTNIKHTHVNPQKSFSVPRTNIYIIFASLFMWACLICTQNIFIHTYI